MSKEAVERTRAKLDCFVSLSAGAAHDLIHFLLAPKTKKLEKNDQIMKQSA